MIQNNNQLVQLTHLDTMLMQATGIDQITDIRDKIRAMQVYAQNIKASKEDGITIAEARIKAERRAGQELASMDMSKGAEGNSSNQYQVQSSDFTAPTLQDMNISKYQSSKWQLIALIPDDVFNDELAKCHEFLREPTTEGFASIGKRYKPRKKNNSQGNGQDTQQYNIQILHGDMFDILPALDNGSIGLAVADPPYNVTDWQWDKIGSHDDFVFVTDSWLKTIKPLLAEEYNLFWFCSPQYMVAIEPMLISCFGGIQSRIVWHRRNMAMGSDSKYKFIDTWEMIFHCGNKRMNWDSDWDDSRFDVQTHAVPQTNFTDTKYHPTQKPAKLIEALVKYGSYSGDIVLDPFAGSGTTGVVCQNIGRDCILVEREEEYIEVINARLQK
jgi:site-specific DNA-methyltransferase (adenine-specific)